MADETFQVLVEIREKLAGLEKTTREFRETKKEARGLGQTARATFGTFVGASGALGASKAVDTLKRSVIGLHKELIQTDITSRKIMNSFKFVTGSTAGARREFERSYRLADKYGQSVEVVAQSYGQLAAASKGTNLQGQDTIDILEGMLAAATVLGRDGYELEGMLYAVDQMISKGNVQAEELKGQLGERLPGAFQIAARAAGVTTEELNDMLDRGEVLAEDLLPKLAVELDKTFGPEVAEATNTVQAAQNRLKNTWFRTKQELAENGYSDQFIEGLTSMNEALQDPDFKDGLEDITDSLGMMLEVAAFLARHLSHIVDALKDIADLAPGQGGLGLARIYNRRFGEGEVVGTPSSPIDLGVVGDEKDPPSEAIKAVSKIVDLSSRLAQIESGLALSETDRLTPTLLKRERELDLLEKKAELLGEISTLFDEEGDKLMEAGKPDEAFKFYDRRDEASTGQIGALNTIAAEGSFGGQFTAGIAEWMEEFQTFGEAASSVFTDVLDPAVNGFGQTFLSTIRAGGDEMDVVRNIGMQMFENFVVGALNYGMQWLTTQLLIRTGLIGTQALASSMQATATAQQLATTAATTTLMELMWAGPATLATIATLGGAAAQAPMSIMAAKGVVVGMSAIPGAATGGRLRGPGGPTDDAFMIRASNNEFMIPAGSAASIGYDNLEYMRKTGEIPRVETGGASGSGSAGGEAEAVRRQLQVVFAGNDRSLLSALKGDPDFETMVVDITRRNRSDLFDL